MRFMVSGFGACTCAKPIRNPLMNQASTSSAPKSTKLWDKQPGR